MIVYIEDENSEIYMEEIIRFRDKFEINTINYFSPQFHIFKNISEMFIYVPHLKEFETEIRKEVFGVSCRIGLQFYQSRKKNEKVFSHFWS